MEHLSDYIKDAQSKLFEKHGVFFAFSNEQFSKGMQPDTKYSGFGNGMFCPSNNVEAFNREHKAIITEGINRDLKENGEKAIILRELINYECFYTGEVDDCVEALKAYGIDEKAIRKVFAENRNIYS